MKAAFLIRCSTKNQDLSRQTRDLSRLATSMGFEYDELNLVYGEKITGKDDVTKRNRESIDRLLKGAKEQKFDVVLVSEVSRMSRDPASGRVYVRLLVNMGIPVYFKDIDLWTFKPNTTPTESEIRNNEMIIGAAFDAAWKYLKSMKTQIASARRNQLDNGAISVGQPYFGYKNRGGRDKLTKTQWVIDEPKAEVVLATFNEYVKEGSTLKSTALAISDKFGDRFKKGKVSIGTVEHILSFEPYHTGINKINLTDPDRGDVEIFEVEIPVIVPTELYKRAEEKRANNRTVREPYPTQTTYLLSKLLKCPHCGYTMTPKAKSNAEGKCANGCYRMINGKKAMSWICMSGINNLSDCPNRMSVANEKLEPIIWELVKRELIAFANLNNEEREQKVKELEEEIENHSYNIQNYTKEIDKLTARQDRGVKDIIEQLALIDDLKVREALTQSLIKSSKEYSKEIEEYESNKQHAKAEIERLSLLKERYSQPNVPTDIIEKAEANPVEQRNLIKELVTKIVPHKITTYEKWTREKGKDAFKEKKVVKNGAVLLEVTTINGLFYIFYNANGNDTTRYAYYIGADIIYSGSDLANDYMKSLGKEVFYIKSPYLLFLDERAGDLDAIVNINGFIEVAKANEWVLSYQYKPDKPED